MTTATTTVAATATTQTAESMPLDQVRFDYGTARVSDIQIHDVTRSPGGRLTLDQLEIAGRPVAASRRFWRSFFTRFGIAENVFRYFTPAEVFGRIEQCNGDDTFQYCVASPSTPPHKRKNKTPQDQILAITNIKRPVIRYDEVIDLLQRYGGHDIHYHDGVVSSTHQPRGGSRQFAIGGDAFRDRFCMETPVDGYGHPRLFLSVLRMVCTNGMIGYSRAFRSDISVGKHMDHCIARALESFDNGDGYSALRQRFESSQRSWASVRECLQLGQCLERLLKDDQFTRSGLLGRFRTLAGNLSELYGLANLEALSDKRRRVLPAKCRVYDLINFASEVATHHAKSEGANRLQAFIGSLISDEYDLEGTADDAAEFDAFFVHPDDHLPPQSRN
ncbi:DUF932 domain-containing protein [Roseimaritima sediminicola]|uniref:DUF932 domain-containing protein n=1 Tax=Roseimaritima sediminicola TaxID=2662066 RepID=UPI001F3C210F|nr:DUF932 domain-containing protein [Roseimaritima sediminicola]